MWPWRVHTGCTAHPNGEPTGAGGDREACEGSLRPQRCLVRTSILEGGARQHRRDVNPTGEASPLLFLPLSRTLRSSAGGMECAEDVSHAENEEAGRKRCRNTGAVQDARAESRGSATEKQRTRPVSSAEAPRPLPRVGNRSACCHDPARSLASLTRARRAA